jgi:hypothetical protein
MVLLWRLVAWFEKFILLSVQHQLEFNKSITGVVYTKINEYFIKYPIIFFKTRLLLNDTIIALGISYLTS